PPPPPPQQHTVLVITGIGYKTVEIPIGAESSIHITLEEENVALDEVVVTGYSIDNRREVAGSVSVVKAQDLTAVPSGNVEQQLQGRVPGVTVITNGQPGTSSQIRVRGFGSFENNEPLYVVDGVPVNATDFLNPDDIENVTVLKDAASASIYGARAASGVIVYTTKTGKRNAKKPSVSYDGLWGVTTPGEGQKMMNTADFVEWTRRGYENSRIVSDHPQFGSLSNWKIPDYLLVGKRTGVSGNIDLNAERALYNVTDFSRPIYQVIAPNRQGTDWYKEITRNAPLTRHTIGLSGGGEGSRYYVGFSLQDQQGILKNNNFKRYTFRANTEFNILKNLRLGENLQFSYRQALGLSGNHGGKGVASEENDILFAFRMPPIIPVYDVFGGYAGTAALGFNNGQNPVARRDRLGNNRGFDGIGFGNIYLELEPTKGLVLRSSIGGNYRGTNFRSYEPRTYENSENNSAFSYREGSGYSFAWTLTNTAAYKKVFDGKHSADVLIGQEALDSGTGRNTSASGQNPFSTDPDYVSLNTAGNRQVFGEQFKGVRFYSLFGQLRYAFRDKYIATAVVRRDGSSRFGAAHRYGVFPAVSAAWRISGESFMQPVKWISDLKLRAGYGSMGNSNAVDPNNQHTLYASSISQSSYDIKSQNTSVVNGYYRSRIGNPNAKWETCVTKNAGLDGSFFNNKLDVTLDVWQKDTKELLVKLPLQAPNGFQAQQPHVNSAQMVNKGLDIQITAYGKLRSDMDYEFTVNGSFLHNEITSIKEGLTYLASVNREFRGQYPIRNQLGHSLSSFYGYQTLGLFQNAHEVASAPAQAGAAPGRFRFADISGPEGRPNKEIDVNDRTYIGSPIPKFTGGVNLKLKYKNFEAAAYLYASLGNKIYNQSKWFTDFYATFQGAGISERAKDSWTPDNPHAAIPRFESTSDNFSINSQTSSYYVESGNYLRMQNLSLAYYLPQTALSVLKAERLKVFMASNNLFTLTKYTGLDPGVGGDTDTVFGVDVGNYPITRSFTVGI
ncbi:MAG: SusC/RagA family protein, partial [Candidatus Nephrothrix sp. EaCA]